MPDQAPTKGLAKYNPDTVAGELSTVRALVTDSGFVAAVKQLAPRHLPAERLVRMVVAAASRNPRLLDCTKGSLLKSAIEASILGLDCSGLLGRGYLVPYKNGHLSQRAGRDVYEAQFQAGYLGLCDLARRSGEITSVRAKAVFEGDEFSYEEGLQPSLTHKPSDSDIVHDKTTLRYVYAIAWHKDGGQPDFVVMRFAEVERHRLISKAANGNFWTKHYVAMALKTVARQLCKWLPQSPELSDQLQREYESESDPYPTIGVDALENKDRTGDLVNRLESNGGGGESEPKPPTAPEQPAEAEAEEEQTGEHDFGTCPPDPDESPLGDVGVVTPAEVTEEAVPSAEQPSADPITVGHIERRIKGMYSARKSLRDKLRAEIFGKPLAECTPAELQRGHEVLIEVVRRFDASGKPDDAGELGLLVKKCSFTAAQGAGEEEG